MRVLGWILSVPGWIALFLIDVFSSIWLYNEHGLIWVIVVWVTFVPLLIIPFLAGWGIPYIAAMALVIIGQLLVSAGEERALKRGSR
jgi:hypothetical protein